MTRLISITAAAAAALALAAPAGADAYKHPGDAFAKDAFARDYFRAHPGTSSWNSLRPLGEKWIALSSTWS